MAVSGKYGVSTHFSSSTVVTGASALLIIVEGDFDVVLALFSPFAQFSVNLRIFLFYIILYSYS